MAKSEQNSFRQCQRWLGEEFRRPADQVSFWCYLVVVVIAAGGLGIWIAAFRDQTWPSVVGSLLTYFPAIAAASCSELILSDERPKYARSVAIFSAAVLVAAAGVIFFNDPGIAMVIVGIVASIYSLSLWWLANSNNPTLRDNPQAPSGGDPTANAAGNADGFNL